MDSLSIWTVYESPLDYPERFVARRWTINPAPSPTDDVIVADDMSSLQAMMPPGMVRMPRQPGDDPVIVETWV